METKIELERILAKLTGSQRTLVKGWYRRANMFADLVDNVVISGELMFDGEKFSCSRFANLKGKTIEYNYKIFSLSPLRVLENIFDTKRVDPRTYLQEYLIERKKKHAKKQN